MQKYRAKLKQPENSELHTCCAFGESKGAEQKISNK